MVILLLGILTATALPRFLDVTDEAHTAVVNAVQGGLVTGGALFRAQWIAEGEPTTAIAEFNSLFPIATGDGYPAGTADRTINLHSDCSAIFTGLLQAGRPTIEAPAGSTVGAITGAEVTAATAGIDFLAKETTANTCTFAYIGQFTSVAGDTIPTLQFDLTSGDITAGSI